MITDDKKDEIFKNIDNVFSIINRHSDGSNNSDGFENAVDQLVLHLS